MPDQTFYEFPAFVEHHTEKKPTSKVTMSKGNRGNPKVSEISRRLSQGPKARPEPIIMIPGVPEVKGDWTPPNLETVPQSLKYKGPRSDEFLPVKMDKYVDMGPIKKGSILYMSNKHVEKDDYFSFDEGHQVATF